METSELLQKIRTHLKGRRQEVLESLAKHQEPHLTAEKIGRTREIDEFTNWLSDAVKPIPTEEG